MKMDYDFVLEVWRDWGRYHVREDRLEYSISDICQSEAPMSLEEGTYLYHRLREWQRTGR